jgi:hypothetical protein
MRATRADERVRPPGNRLELYYHAARRQDWQDTIESTKHTPIEIESIKARKAQVIAIQDIQHFASRG